MPIGRARSHEKPVARSPNLSAHHHLREPKSWSISQRITHLPLNMIITPQSTVNENLPPLIRGKPPSQKNVRTGNVRTRQKGSRIVIISPPRVQNCLKTSMCSIVVRTQPWINAAWPSTSPEAGRFKALTVAFIATLTGIGARNGEEAWKLEANPGET